MALPKLNATPKYELVIPSTRQKVRFRPFLMKEEKVMLIAMESEDTTLLMDTIVDTISTCIEDDINVKKFTTFDIEYCFLKIRAKSVGETSQLLFNCSNCQHENQVNVNIDDIKLDVPKIDPLIKIDEEISVEMQWPNFNSVAKNSAIMNSDSSVDQIFAMVRACLVSINTQEERFAVSDHSPEEIDNFIESLSTDQFSKIRDYIEKMPRLKHDIHFVCSSCAHENKITVEGMQSFFS
jgi:hypothetical protein